MPNQYVNKVQLADGTVLLDLTSDTVASNKLVSGETAHDKSGNPVQGALNIQHCYTGSGSPPSSLGVDGDVYLQIDGNGGTGSYQAKSNIHPSASSQTVTADAGYDGLSSVQTNAVVLTNLIAANIKSGVTVKVGDSTDDDCVASVLGTLSGAQTATGTFTGNGARSIDVTCSFEPELVYWYGDPGSSASSGTVSCLIVKDMMAANRYRNNATTNSANIQVPITGMNTGGSSYNFKSSYANGKVTLYSFSSNARNLFTSGRTYSYTFMRWS